MVSFENQPDPEREAEILGLKEELLNPITSLVRLKQIAERAREIGEIQSLAEGVEKPVSQMTREELNAALADATTSPEVLYEIYKLPIFAQDETPLPPETS